MHSTEVNWPPLVFSTLKQQSEIIVLQITPGAGMSRRVRIGQSSTHGTGRAVETLSLDDWQSLMPSAGSDSLSSVLRVLQKDEDEPNDWFEWQVSALTESWRCRRAR